MSIKKDFFAPLSKGLGATRRAAMLLLVMLLTMTQAAWADGISYLDATGTQQSCTTYTTVESSSTSWNSGWFVVNSNTTISDRITVSGTVNLILTNNATLTASKGITVGSDATLNIYAQTDDEATMGALVADATNGNANWYAGIGGVENTDAGMITINGGQINATGWCAAGIGSGGGTSTVGTITINGGIITAQDCKNYGAGIGGGFSGGKASTINLNGGIINAAGIGSGYYGGDCSITVNISDGIRKIVATPVKGGACIGSGESASGSVTVNFLSGGNVVTGDAKDAVFYDTGEGAQRQVRAKALNHTVSMSDDLKAHITVSTELAITGETVTLTLGTAVDASTLKVNDGTSDLTLTDAGNRNYTFTMPAGNVTVTATLLQTYSVNLPANMEIVSATNTADGSGKYISGTVVTFKASFSYTASNVYDGANTLTADDSGNYSVTVGTADITVTATIEHSSNIDLTDAPSDFAAINNDVLTGSTSHTVTIADGANITLKNSTITGGIVCNGTATITLVGTNSVTGLSRNISDPNTNTYNSAGIQIGGEGTTLTIRGNGSLTATGGSQSAGIGVRSALSNYNESDVSGGNIVIEGGNIVAQTSGYGAAGIGTGCTLDRISSIGTITIKGGTVTATGGTDANGIGNGDAYGVGGTSSVGTITFYDSIDLIDASSISDFGSVVYMHGETDVTASKTDYFAIVEDGDRRIIAPKDDTDYTITIADGIEHGTLTGATTAKYMETVNITATPDFGYRLSNLVVKDADNNDVASTGNTFLMPKSNVTVSAVFEQGTHGTTEFAWSHYNPGQEFVPDATIYDGVTTVNLQQGQSYSILKYEENSRSMFLLDNNTDNADIPYSGGTGIFQNFDVTRFSLGNEATAGYYDITMTDVGNGKWNVSILKTAGQMDVVPDQTYTGSEIKPEPLVIAGSLSLTKGTDYTYSYENNTDAGTAKVIATFQGTYASLGYVEKEFTILPSTVIVNVTGNGTVTYNGKSAASGETFGVAAEKGTDVTLTLAPESGYAVRSVAYGYTNNSGTTAIGLKLPINGSAATLTVPNDLKDGTYVNLTVTFVSALAGGADEASAVALTGNTVTDLAGGWYKVDSDITFDHTLNLLGDTHLIIADGKTMTVNTATDRGILSDYTLFVRGDGALSVTTTADYGIAVRVGNYVQTGATVTASGYIGIRCEDDFIGFDFDNDFTFSGGQLTATGSGGGGIDADNDITLSCTNATDFIQASSYTAHGAVKIADGKALTDGTEASNGMNGYSGTLTNEQRITIGGKTLHRAVITSYVEASGTLHENVIAIPLDNTMTTLAAGWYVVNSDVAYTGTVTLSGDVKLILGDGCTMSFGTENANLNATIMECQNHNLTIYGQSGGTGWLKAYSEDGINSVNYYTQNSGNVVISDGNGACINAGEFTILGGTLDLKDVGGANGEIVTTENINIRGGKLWAKCMGLKTMNGKIILGYTNATDEIYAYSYQPQNGLEIADGKTLVDENGTIWSGTLEYYQIGFHNSMLRPFKTITLADNANNSSTISEWNGGVAEVTLSGRTLYKDGAWNTLCLPFSLSAEQIAANTDFAGATLMTMDVTKKNGFDVEDGTLYLWFKTATTIEAGVPYLVKWEKAADYEGNEANYDISNPVFEGVTISNSTAQAVESSTEGLETVQMVGTYSPVSVTANDKSILFLGDANTLYYSTVDRQIRSCRAYFTVPYINGHAEAKARAFALSFDGEETTGILEVSANYNGVTDEAWYSLDGVRLSGKPTQRGMYINKGKKILVK